MVIGQVPIYDPKYPVNAFIADAPNHIEHLAVATNEGTKAFDGFHYDRASVQLMGERLATALMTLTAEKAEPESDEKDDADKAQETTAKE